MDLFPQKVLRIEQILHKFFEFARKLYDETHMMKKKLLEIEILDISQTKTYSFFKEINNFYQNSCLQSIEFPNFSHIVIKLKENSGSMNFEKLSLNKPNSEITLIIAELINLIEPWELYILSKSHGKITEIIKINHLSKNFESIYENGTNNVSKKEYYFIVIGRTHVNYDFQKTIDFFKVWSIFNGDINIIAKYFPKKILKNLLCLEFPLLSAEIVKIFQIHNIFSLYSDNDCFLMNILEDQKFDFQSNVYVNGLQFFNCLNIEENVLVFKKLFSIKKEAFYRKFSFDFLNNVINMDILLGVNTQLKEALYVFSFANNNILFDNVCCFDNDDFLALINKIIKICLSKLDMSSYGYATFLLKNDVENFQEHFFKQLFLKTLTKSKKTKNYSIFLVINFTFDYNKMKILFNNHKNFYKDRIKQMNVRESFGNWISEKIYETFNNFKKQTQFEFLITPHEKKLMEVVNSDIPKISNYLGNIIDTLRSNFMLVESLSEKSVSRHEINKILWGKLLFEK